MDYQIQDIYVLVNFNYRYDIIFLTLFHLLSLLFLLNYYLYVNIWHFLFVQFSLYNLQFFQFLLQCSISSQIVPYHFTIQCAIVCLDFIVFFAIAQNFQLFYLLFTLDTFYYVTILRYIIQTNFLAIDYLIDLKKLVKLGLSRKISVYRIIHIYFFLSSFFLHYIYP